MKCTIPLLVIGLLCSSLLCSVPTAAANESHTIPKAKTELGTKTPEQLQQLFVKKLAKLIKEDISAAIETQISKEDHPLKIFMQKLFEQDIISTVAKQAIELLKALEDQLKQEEEAAKNDGEKEKEKKIKEKRKKTREARKFMTLANKYLDKEIKQIDKLLEKSMKKVNKTLNAAEQIIKEFLVLDSQKTL